MTATLALLDGAFEHNDRPRDEIALLERYADGLPTHLAKFIQAVGLQLAGLLDPPGFGEGNDQVLPFLHSRIVELSKEGCQPSGMEQRDVNRKRALLSAVLAKRVRDRPVRSTGRRAPQQRSAQHALSPNLAPGVSQIAG